LLEAALSVSEYTDKIDIISYKNKAQRINEQIRDICAILVSHSKNSNLIQINLMHLLLKQSDWPCSRFGLPNW